MFLCEIPLQLNYITVNSTHSVILFISVHSSTILGPLLFSLYTTPLITLITSCNFAGDLINFIDNVAKGHLPNLVQ